MRIFLRLLASRDGGGAAEFALVLPVLLLFLFGIIDVGRFMWECNKAEKATQMGVRYAVVADPIASGLSTYSFAVGDGIPRGDPIPPANFTSATCDDSDCDPCVATTGNFCDSVGYDGASFGNIVAWMGKWYDPIDTDNVEIEYRNVGVGFAGDPDGPDVSTLVTVKLSGLDFQSFVLFGGSVDLPSFRAALTLEDAETQRDFSN